MKVVMKVDELGRGSVLIDGKDITNHVTGLSLVAKPGQMTNITVSLQGVLEFEGLANVERGATSFGIADFIYCEIDDMDPDEIEQEALRRLGMGDASSMTETILSVVKENFSGIES